MKRRVADADRHFAQEAAKGPGITTRFKGVLFLDQILIGDFMIACVITEAVSIIFRQLEPVPDVRDYFFRIKRDFRLILIWRALLRAMPNSGLFGQLA